MPWVYVKEVNLDRGHRESFLYDKNFKVICKIGGGDTQWSAEVPCVSMSWVKKKSLHLGSQDIPLGLDMENTQKGVCWSVGTKGKP